MDPKDVSKRAYQAFTQLSRRMNWLMRQQLSACPITVQQCYALESLMEGPKSMNALASDVAVHCGGGAGDGGWVGCGSGDVCVGSRCGWCQARIMLRFA